MFRNLSYKFQRLMAGRYGYDELSKSLIFISLALVAVYYLTHIRLFYYLAVFALVYSYFRMFSKNFAKRRAELQKYYEIKRKFSPKISLLKNKWAHRKTYKYIKCPKCKFVYRYPKGMGKIEITCKNCKHKMIKRT